MDSITSLNEKDRVRIASQIAGPLAALAKANGMDLSEAAIERIISDPNSDVDVPQLSIINPAGIIIEIVIRTAGVKGRAPLDIKLRNA